MTTLPGYITVAFILSTFSSHSLSAQVDLGMEYFHVDGLLDKIPLNQTVPISPTVNFKNHGPDPVTEPDADQQNFDMKIYLSDSGDPSSASYWRDMGLAPLSEYMRDLFKSTSPVGYVIGTTDTDAVINILSEDCEFVKYLCIEIIFVNTTRYSDPVPANNFECAEFGPRSEGKIGEIECYIDIQAVSLEVLGPVSLSHMPGVSSTFTVEMEIRNDGERSVNDPPLGDHNFAPKIYLTDGATLESSAFNIMQDGNDVTFDNTLPNGGSLTLPSFVATATVPLTSDLCERVTHLCVEITIERADLQSFIKDSGDEDLCLELKAVAAGGAGVKLGCPTGGTDVAMQSFVVRDSSTVTYDIGIPTTITIDTNIVNLGSESVRASSMGNNYRFELFIIDNLTDIALSTDIFEVMVDESSATNLRRELVYGFPINISSLVATVTLPPSTSRCRSFKSMCLKAVLLNVTSFYTEGNPENNFICIPFNNSGIGSKLCPDLDVDIRLSNLAVTPLAGNSFPIDVQTDVSLSVDAENYGSGSIPDVSGTGVNFRLVAFFTDNGDLEDANFTLSVPGVTLGTDQSQRGIAMGQTLTFPISSYGITVPKQHCDVITNLCVKLEIDSTSLYTDTTPELSDACADIRHYINCFTDLAAIQLVVVTTPPVTYNPGYRKDIVAELTVMNHGGIIIEASDDYNFKPTVFLTNSADFAFASYKNPLEGVFTTFDDKITSKTPTTLQEFPIPITIPTNKFECEEISHLCLQLNHNIARYNDTDPNNDFVCISFGEVAQGNAGTFSCNVSVDLEVPSQTFSPVDVYTFDQVASVDVILSVINTGPGDIARTRGSSVNYDVTAYLTDSANFEDATVRIRQADVDITLAQLQQELKSGQSVSLSFSSDILVPSVNCSRISHVCFSVTLRSADDRVYTDVDSSNNDVCIEFGPKEEGKAGKILCYVDLAALSLVVLDPQPLTYVPGEDTHVLVRLTVTNYGGLDVSTAPPWTHNFGTEVYLTDGENLYTSTNISQPTVDKLFLHEVGSHFRVSLPVFYVKVNIPTAIDCKNIRYLCTLLLHNEQRYLDVDRSNDYVCIRFGPVDGGMAGILECDGVTDYPATQAHPRSTAVTVRQRPITTQQTRDRYTTSRDSDHDIGASDGLGKLRTEGLALHYVMIIVSLVFITVVVIAVVIIKCRHKGASSGICYR